MSGSCFAEVLREHIELTANEVAALERLEERRRSMRRGDVLQRSDEPATEVFLLRAGMVMGYVLLDDGSRQILRFHFPGDLLGTAGIVYRDAPETLCAMSDCVVCPIEKSALSDLIVEHPRLAAMMMAFALIERVALTDRLASLGRTPAKARIGALLLDLRSRGQARGSGEDSFLLNLTQEEIGDATGLTSVHVNRMLRQLHEDGMIERAGGRVTITDAGALARASNYVDRYSGLDLAWLPERR